MPRRPGWKVWENALLLPGGGGGGGWALLELTDALLQHSTSTEESWEQDRQFPKMADNMNVCVQNAQPCLPS